MRLIVLTAVAALALSACNNGNDAANDTNGTDLQVGNLIVNDTGTDAVNATDMNAMNSDTQNAVMNDLTHNDVDTNLANGQ